MPWVAALTAFGSSLALIPLVRWVSIRTGKVAQPRPDRWHQRPTALLGGVGIFLACLIGILTVELTAQTGLEIQWNLLLGAGLVFVLGIYDDLFRLSPATKLIGQILAATLAISSGVVTNFFTPRLANPILAQLPNILLTYIWLVGITNAINLLDNVDGLAGGIALITAGLLSYLFWSSGSTSWLVVTLALLGALLGFLIFNFPPASIFMGDSGSMFLGFILALLAIVRQPQASNVFAVLGVPTLLFLLPILDTILVTVTRIMRGQSPVQGGRDHTSHRLIAFGLTERRALVVMYSAALGAGLAGLAIEALDYRLSLVIVPLLVLSLAILAAYLGGLKVVSGPLLNIPNRALTRIMLELTFKRHLIEVILDFFLIGIIYYMSVLAVFRLSDGDQLLSFYLDSVPFALAGSYVSFFVFGVYRGVWRYVGLDDLLRYGRAGVGAGLITAGLAWLASFPQVFPWMVFFVFGILLFLGLSTSRSSFKLLALLSVQQPRQEGERVLICGAGDAGEMAVRWIQMNPSYTYRPVGFIDSDTYMLGRQIHGIEVLGLPDQLEQILASRSIVGIIVTENFLRERPEMKQIYDTARAQGCWVRVSRLEFEPLFL